MARRGRRPLAGRCGGLGSAGGRPGERGAALACVAGLAPRREIRLEHEPAGEIELVEVDGREARPHRLDALTPSDLLSDQLEAFGRDRIYEEAVRSFSSQPT